MKIQDKDLYDKIAKLNVSVFFQDEPEKDRLLNNFINSLPNGTESSRQKPYLKYQLEQNQKYPKQDWSKSVFKDVMNNNRFERITVFQITEREEHTESPGGLGDRIRRAVETFYMSSLFQSSYYIYWNKPVAAHSNFNSSSVQNLFLDQEMPCELPFCKKISMPFKFEQSHNWERFFKERLRKYYQQYPIIHIQSSITNLRCLMKVVKKLRVQLQRKDKQQNTKHHLSDDYWEFVNLATNTLFGQLDNKYEILASNLSDHQQTQARRKFLQSDDPTKTQGSKDYPIIGLQYRAGDVFSGLGTASLYAGNSGIGNAPCFAEQARKICLNQFGGKCSYFLSADSSKVIDRLKELMSNESLLVNQGDIGHFLFNGEKPSGVERAIIDWKTLQKADALVISRSSFGETAAHISGKPAYRLKQTSKGCIWQDYTHQGSVINTLNEICYV